MRLFFLAGLSMILVLFASVSDVGVLEVDDDPVVGDEVLVDVVADDVVVEVLGEEEDSVPVDVSNELPAIKDGVD